MLLNRKEAYNHETVEILYKKKMVDKIPGINPGLHNFKNLSV